MREKNFSAVADDGPPQEFLRQHYLDQVHGSVTLPRHTLSLCSASADAGWLPGDMGEFRLRGGNGQYAKENRHVESVQGQISKTLAEGSDSKHFDLFHRLPC